jgi:pyruvate-formate lyase-activating enzyme
MSDPKSPVTAKLSGQPVKWLTFSDHDPDFLHLTYVYPVLSRRMQGISIGINLNTNNACNWACAYCQVPGLHRGDAPEVNLGLLEAELKGLLDNPALSPMIPPDTPQALRQIRDIAFSGNGEPTSSPQFVQAVGIARRQRDAHGLNIPLVLITNGSLMLRPEVQAGVKALAEAGGVVWFKVDRLLPDSMKRINGISYKPEQIQHRLDVACSLAPVWLQTCWLAWDGQAPGVDDEAAYLDFVARNAHQIQGVHLYGLARPSLQPEAPHLTALSESTLNTWADKIRATGVTVQVSA